MPTSVWFSVPFPPSPDEVGPLAAVGDVPADPVVALEAGRVAGIAGDAAGGSVAHHARPLPSLGDEAVFEVGLEGAAVDDAGDHEGSDHAGRREPGDKGGCVPLSVGDRHAQAFAAPGPVMDGCLEQHRMRPSRGNRADWLRTGSKNGVFRANR